MAYISFCNCTVSSETKLLFLMLFDLIELYFIEGGKQKVSTVKFETPAAKGISIEDFRIVSSSDKVNVSFT